VLGIRMEIEIEAKPTRPARTRKTGERRGRRR
jgi:hypothetical protein